MPSGQPSLFDLLVAGLSATAPVKPLFGKPYYPLSQAAMVGVYLYAQAALIGLRYRVVPHAIAAMIWDPMKHDLLWAHVKESVQSRDARSDDAQGSLRSYFLTSEYPALYSFAGKTAIMQDEKSMKRIADSHLPVEQAQADWAWWVAEGLGFALLEPARVEQMVAQDYKVPDPARWREAHEAGLDIPAEPDYISVEEMTGNLVEGVQALAAEYYPDLLDELR